MKKLIFTAVVTVAAFIVAYIATAAFVRRLLGDLYMFPKVQSAFVVASGIAIGLAIGSLVCKKTWEKIEDNDWQ